jgi:hypothetical protein
LDGRGNVGLMTDSSHIPNETKARARFVIASEARQSSALFGQSGLLRRSAPRNDAAGLMAEAVAIPNEAKTRARSRRPELVSGPMPRRSGQSGCSQFSTNSEAWTLKQVQGDGGACG